MNQARAFTLFLFVLLSGLIGDGAAVAAIFKTDNFTVYCDDAEFAEKVGKQAEKSRKEKAKLWLDKELPKWSRPCNVTVRLGEDNPAGGMTRFTFNDGEVFNWSMFLQGPKKGILRDIVPHEVTHTIFASHFRHPLPRWWDEGGSVLSESNEVIVKMHKSALSHAAQKRLFPFKTLLSMMDYPQDKLRIDILYAQGTSLADYLISHKGGRKAYLGLIDDSKLFGWDYAFFNRYGYKSIEDVEKSWMKWLKNGRVITMKGEVTVKRHPRRPVLKIYTDPEICLPCRRFENDYRSRRDPRLYRWLNRYFEVEFIVGVDNVRGKVPNIPCFVVNDKRAVFGYKGPAWLTKELTNPGWRVKEGDTSTVPGRGGAPGPPDRGGGRPVKDEDTPGPPDDGPEPEDEELIPAPSPPDEGDSDPVSVIDDEKLDHLTLLVERVAEHQLTSIERLDRLTEAVEAMVENGGVTVLRLDKLTQAVVKLTETRDETVNNRLDKLTTAVQKLAQHQAGNPQSQRRIDAILDLLRRRANPDDDGGDSGLIGGVVGRAKKKVKRGLLERLVAKVGLPVALGSAGGVPVAAYAGYKLIQMVARRRREKKQREAGVNPIRPAPGPDSVGGTLDDNFHSVTGGGTKGGGQGNDVSGFPGGASTQFVPGRDVTELGHILRLAKQEGHDSLLDAAYGRFAQDEIERELNDEKSEHREYLLNLVRTIKDRIDEVAPVRFKPSGK